MVDQQSLARDEQSPGRAADAGRNMHALVLDRYGEAEQLTLREIPRPACLDDQVTLRVEAASINPIDWRIRRGDLRWLLPAKFPLVLGYDVAGEIVEAGAVARAQGWNVGDNVLSFLDGRHGGGYAEYAVTGYDVLAKMPACLSFAEGAAVPLAASTALQSLRDLGRLKEGQSVLVNGASGGVGIFAVQLGRALGARVTGTCSESNLDFVRELGADHVIDYQREDFTLQGRTYDIIFDAVAKRSYGTCRRALNPRGCYITTVPSASTLFFQVVTRRLGRRCRNILVRPRGKDLRLIAQMIDAGQVRPIVQHAYSWKDAAAAHRVSEAGHVRGKLVLMVDMSDAPRETPVS